MFLVSDIVRSDWSVGVLGGGYRWSILTVGAKGLRPCVLRAMRVTIVQ